MMSSIKQEISRFPGKGADGIRDRERYVRLRPVIASPDPIDY